MRHDYTSLARPEERTARRHQPTLAQRQSLATQGSAVANRLQAQAGNHAATQLLAHGTAANELAALQMGLQAPVNRLTPEMRREQEARFGQNFGQVRLHTGAQARQAADQLQAAAFTVGNDIVLGAPPAALQTPVGQHLLAHELAHVVQQQPVLTSGARRPSSPALEAQAAGAATAVSRGQQPTIAPVGFQGIQRKAKEGETEPTKDDEAKRNKPKPASGGFFATLWSGIKQVGSALWSGAQAVGSAVWAGLKTLGGWIATGAEAVWQAAQWVGRQLWDKLTGIVQRVGRWVARLPERVGRLFAGLWQGLTSLKPWSLAWWKSLGKASTWGDFLSWLGARLVDLIEITGVGEFYETVMDFIKFNTRTLRSQEVAIASSIFGASINYSLVRVDERAVIGPAFSDRPYTSFHTINGWGALSADTLIHELTHVWQYEHAGAIYMPQALHAQIAGAGYDYKGAAGLQAADNAGQGIASFNREQQAQIVQDFYRLKQGMSIELGAATSADLPLYAKFVKDVSTLSVAQLLA